MTYNGNQLAAGVLLYVDGVSRPLSVVTDSLGANTILNNNNVIIGNDRPGASGFEFDGRIDETRIYNRTLSAAEAKQLYLMGR